MRTWRPDIDSSPRDVLGGFVAGVLPALGEARFGVSLLEALRDDFPVGSLAVYRTGALPAIYFSASVGVPDTTRDCWRAYLSGPIRHDRTLRGEAREPAPRGVRLCHITAGEVPPEHRAKVYEAHGVLERVSVVEQEADDSVFAVNLYRHQHQRALSDRQLADFGRLGTVLMALARKHVAIDLRGTPGDEDATARRLLARCSALTRRELEVCTRLLKGMTQEGIAADLSLGLPTVKTYRNRAFSRLGIHFRSELFALILVPHAAAKNG